MAQPEIHDADRVRAAVIKARRHAKALGKPLQLDRVALFLGVNHGEIAEWMNYDGNDKERRAIADTLKLAKQESRADLMDALSDKGNVAGYIFQGKVNHNMVETTAHDLRFVPVRFTDEDAVAD